MNSNATPAATSTAAARRDALLCGFQSSGDGRLHLGNLLGSALPFANLAASYGDAFCMVADLHALSGGDPVPGLASARRRTARELCALVPEDAHLFLQSDVPEICSVYALLSMVVPLGDLRRMTQFEQKGALRENPSSGLLLYPALMAADILSVRADAVAVGEDQLQHAELARGLASRLAFRGARLPSPEALVPEGAARVKSLQDPAKKMSKSDPNAKACAFFDELSASTAAKIRRCVSDSAPIGFGDEAFAALDSRPGLANMVEILSGMAAIPRRDAYDRLAGGGFAHAKAVLAEAAEAFLSPLRERLASVDDAALDARLRRGADRARANASRTLSEMRKAMLGSA